MALQCCMGAQIKCSFGITPSSLAVLPKNRVTTQTPDANIMDNKPLVNILPFGACSSLANPQVAAATAAAFGVLTPMPCIPNIPAPWFPGVPSILLAGMPTLNNTSKLMCAWGGLIEFIHAGETIVQTP